MVLATQPQGGMSWFSNCQRTLTFLFGGIPTMSRKLNRFVFAIAVFLAAFAANVALGADFTVLHSFAGGAAGGDFPQYGTVTVSGSTLFGTTMFGGIDNKGTIFRLNKDGGGFGVMHSFAGSSGWSSNPDGYFPQGGLTLSGSKLFGTAVYGGIYGIGNIFSINTNGNDFNVLHSFSGGEDGAHPYDDLTASGPTMYGMAYSGGGGYGAIYKMNPDGSNFTSVVPFSGSNHGPLGGLTISGTKMYGMTRWSGNIVEGGSLFRINTDLTGFEVLHTFTGAADDGKSPLNSTLTLCGSTLYGVTGAGGTYGNGTLFKINLDGSDFSVLHSFDVGENPQGDLTLVGSSLYGISMSGGSSHAGMIYKIDTDGSDFTIAHPFSYNDGNGTHPIGGLTLDGSTLYGMTMSGGQYGKGTVYALQVPEPATLTLLGFGCHRPFRMVLATKPQGGLSWISNCQRTFCPRRISARVFSFIGTRDQRLGARECRGNNSPAPDLWSLISSPFPTNSNDTTARPIELR